MTGHIHAKIMMEYALLAQEHEKPWEFIQGRKKEPDKWQTYIESCMPTFHHAYEYRLKPKTITINGFEVPEPLRVMPGYGDKYYYPNISLGIVGTIECTSWQNTNLDNQLFNNGLIHLEHESAKAHIEALLSFTKIKAQK